MSAWKRHWKIWCLGLVLCTGLGLAAGLPGRARASVTLIYFRGAAVNQQARLEWETATELNTVGFYIKRSEQQSGTFTQMNDSLIPAQGDSLTGAAYAYVDTTVVNGRTYWYQLESIEASQQSVLYDTLVSVQIGGVATPTSSPTPTFTPTTAVPAQPTHTPSSTPSLTPSLVPSATPTSYVLGGQVTSSAGTLVQTATFPPSATPLAALSTLQPTLTPVRSATPRPQPPTPTGTLRPVFSPLPPPSQVPAATATPVALPAVSPTTAALSPYTHTPTATFVPLPSITPLFFTPTSVDALATYFPASEATATPAVKGGITRLWPLLVILLIWVILAGWFFYAQRNLQ